MKKTSLIVAVVASFALSGCGWADRVAVFTTGTASEVCQDGVLYLQFTSGVSVKYLPTGDVAQCGNAASTKAAKRDSIDDAASISMKSSVGSSIRSGMSGSVSSSKSNTLAYSSGAGLATAE